MYFLQDELEVEHFGITVVDCDPGWSGREHDQNLKRATERERYQEKDRTPFTSGNLKQFEPGECVIKSRTDWWRGKIYELVDVEDSLPDTIDVGAENPAGALSSGFDDEPAEEA